MPLEEKKLESVEIKIIKNGLLVEVSYSVGEEWEYEKTFVPNAQEAWLLIRPILEPNQGLVGTAEEAKEQKE